MVTVLLAIDNERPNQAVFNFAVQFCRRMKAKLDIVRITRPQAGRSRGPVRDALPQPLSQVEFSEPFINYKQALQADDPDQAVARYVRNHRNVVLTIYDTHRSKSTLLKKQKKLELQAAYPLVVPVVMARCGPI
jgi:K+-sensing histidine kinase KdpD